MRQAKQVVFNSTDAFLQRRCAGTHAKRALVSAKVAAPAAVAPIAASIAGASLGLPQTECVGV